MQALKASIPRAFPVEAVLPAADNSGAKMVKIFTVVGLKTRKGRISSAALGDLVMASVKKGRPDMRKQVVYAVIIRQKKEFRRPDGMRVAFEDNAVVICKDEKGNPKGTLIKGPIAREVCDRWPAIAKIASIIV
ncbi:MAG: 50S ribosomal protein L14 [Nanoarchaeota archaeon]|jgi:large subunit ribosomal protein L14